MDYNTRYLQSLRIAAALTETKEISLFERLHLLDRQAEENGAPGVVALATARQFGFDLNELENHVDQIEAKIALMLSAAETAKNTKQ